MLKSHVRHTFHSLNSPNLFTKERRSKEVGLGHDIKAITKSVPPAINKAANPNFIVIYLVHLPDFGGKPC